MKHNIFKYVAIAAALLATAINAEAQYNHEGGVSTSKSVTGPDSNGNYTIRLETFATGTTTVVTTYTPVDVVLVLDVSGSMEEPKGQATQLSNNVNISYNTIANSDVSYFYRVNISNEYHYFKIYPEFYNNRYYLYYDYGSNIAADRKQYITNNGTQQTRPTGATSATATIFSTSNTRVVRTASTSRMEALKEGVKAFIEEINNNNHPDPAESNVGNRISIITYSDNASTVCSFTPVDGNLSTLKGYVDNFRSGGGTYSNAGLTSANTQLLSARTDANKVVVMFTDGLPSNWDAINTSRTTKNDRGASVYTVGVFETVPATNSQTWRYMNYVSSNYPNATGINNAGTGGNANAGYYKDATDGDLTAIFVSIAQGEGSSDQTIAATTQVRDVVTNSFVLPDNVTAAGVKVYTSAATGTGTGAETETLPTGWADPQEYTAAITKIVYVDANGNPIADNDNTTPKANKALIVENFDYSADDSSEGAGDGNWVGQRYQNGNWVWKGKKLIIEFNVKADSEATGGESQTNTGKSGVYVKNSDGTYTAINYYAEPHTTLTVNIKIRKTGLRIGESATFELMRIRPKGYNPAGATPKDRVANLEYNLIGKPKPGTHDPAPGLSPDDADPSKYYESMGWESFKKVILTNLSDTNGKEVIKDVLALDPYWVYMVVEDDWGWAYTMTGDTNQVGDDGTYTTSSVEVNPFRFHNTENSDAVKHAEAVMINHFQSKEEGASSYTEHKKSSKTKF